MKYLKGKINISLANLGKYIITSYMVVGASHAEYDDFRNHILAAITFGHGMPITMSSKQALNGRLF